MASNQEPSVNQGSTNSQIPAAAVAALTNATANGEPPIALGALDSNQIMSLLRHLPGVFNKVGESPDFHLYRFDIGSVVDAVAEELRTTHPRAYT